MPCILSLTSGDLSWNSNTCLCKVAQCRSGKGSKDSLLLEDVDIVIVDYWEVFLEPWVIGEYNELLVL